MKKEFDFEKAYQEILQQAEENGAENDMVFQTLMREFKRMKKVCDELYTKLDEVGIAYQEVGSMGQTTFKSNPLVNEYVKAHKTLVSTCASLKDYLDKFKMANDDFLS